MGHHLHTDKLHTEAYQALHSFDKDNVGTPRYLGIAWFWAYEYRHYLRSATIEDRREVHNQLLEANLEVYEESAKHLEIIKRIIR